MNIVSDNPVVTGGTLTGLFVAAWNVIVANGLLDGLTSEGATSVTAFVNILIPVVVAIIVRQFVTPMSNPNLPIGTEVNRTQAEPTGVVVEQKA